MRYLECHQSHVGVVSFTNDIDELLHGPTLHYGVYIPRQVHLGEHVTEIVLHCDTHLRSNKWLVLK